jgi:hypothetical protein
MTKSIRVENADTSNFKVVVEVWDRGDFNRGIPDNLVETIKLDYPTSMTPQGLYITSTRYLIVKENGV